MDVSKAPLADAYADLRSASGEVNRLLRRFIHEDGVVVGWGLCREGQLGTGSRVNLVTPLMIGGRDKPLRIGCSSMASVWLGCRGTLITMGGGSWGELGVPNPNMCPLVTANEVGLPIAVVQIELPQFEPQDVLVDVRGGYAFFAALSRRGEIVLWGANNYAQCSRNLEQQCSPCPERRSIPGEKIIQVGCGNFTVLALTASGAVYGWGYINLLGPEEQIRSQLPSSSFKVVQADSESRTIVIDPVRVKCLERKSITQLRVGPWHAVAIGAQGNVYTWGLGKNGRLGHGGEEDVITPKEITTMPSRVVEASCGGFHTCFVTDNGEAYVCGDNQGGQCAVVGEMMVTTCRRIKTPKNRKVLSATCGRHHTVLLFDNGDVITYGTGLGLGVGSGYGMRLVQGFHIMDNYTTLWMTGGSCHNFSLALPKNMTMVFLGLPHRGVETALHAIELKEGLLCAGLGHGFSILVNRRGCCYAMGMGGWGQLGVDLHNVKDFTPDKVPVVRHAMRVGYLSRTVITQVSAGVSFVAALTDGQRVFTWGNNVYGQCGIGVDPKKTRIAEPKEITWLSDKMIIQISCGCFFAMALSATGDVYTWGSIECCGNGLHPPPSIVPKNLLMTSLGSDSEASILLPVKVSGLSGIITVAAGSWHALALNALGEIFAWGLGANGRLGVGSTEDHHVPVKIALQAHMTRIGCGPFTSFGISDEGKLYVWGANDAHQLSVPSNPVLTPTKVLDDVKEAVMGKFYTLALTYDGDYRFSGTMEHENGRYMSKSFLNTEALPPPLMRKNMQAEGYRGMRVYGGVEHAVALMEKHPVEPTVIKQLHYALRDRPAEIIKNGP
ncbi:regulator of chromosome condensation [Trypanosoma grayi]|uniref:regulator of chromosome condensation n=1 Tax=Trypanosoma grayi TaxID=71804 RepID=UPI0004F44005|nr:regulator of chromosome condensation [Trypanosoma grayi]KEG11113.1 regulator of chromosome condensation [Trypanosoma grayi]